jgi:hypothetical protein
MGWLELPDLGLERIFNSSLWGLLRISGPRICKPLHKVFGHIGLQLESGLDDQQLALLTQRLPPKRNTKRHYPKSGPRQPQPIVVAAKVSRSRPARGPPESFHQPFGDRFQPKLGIENMWNRPWWETMQGLRLRGARLRKMPNKHRPGAPMRSKWKTKARCCLPKSVVRQVGSKVPECQRLVRMRGAVQTIVYFRDLTYSAPRSGRVFWQPPSPGCRIHSRHRTPRSSRVAEPQRTGYRRGVYLRWAGVCLPRTDGLVSSLSSLSMSVIAWMGDSLNP